MFWAYEIICLLTSGGIHLFAEKKKMKANLIKWRDNMNIWPGTLSHSHNTAEASLTQQKIIIFTYGFGCNLLEVFLADLPHTQQKKTRRSLSCWWDHRDGAKMRNMNTAAGWRHKHLQNLNFKTEHRQIVEKITLLFFVLFFKKALLFLPKNLTCWFMVQYYCKLA